MVWAEAEWQLYYNYVINGIQIFDGLLWVNGNALPGRYTHTQLFEDGLVAS